MAPAQIDPISLGIGTLVYAGLGFLWYSPFGLGKLWLYAMGWESRDEVPSLSIQVGWGVTVLVGLLAALAFDLMFDWMAIGGWLDGLLISTVVALCFVLPSGALAIGYEERPILSYLVTAGYHLVGLVLTGTIMGMIHPIY